MFSGDICDLLQSLVRVVDGTEAAAFVLGMEPSGSSVPHLHYHLRWDDPDYSIRAAAVRGFAEMVESSVRHHKDGRFAIDRTETPDSTQYCLVILERHGERVAGAVAVITRCADDNAASDKLTELGHAASRLGYRRDEPPRHPL